MNNPSYYSILPANVRYADITPMAKIMYSEISALSNKYGYCTAANQYFAELYDLHSKSISRLISELETRGFITTELLYKGNTKEITGRRIYLHGIDRVEELKFETPLEQNCGEVVTNLRIGGGNKIVTVNNTRIINITSVNNILVFPNSEIDSANENDLLVSENVKIQVKEFRALVALYGLMGTIAMVQKLENYKGATGAKYKSDYRAILNWVVKWYESEIGKTDSDYDT